MLQSLPCAIREKKAVILIIVAGILMVVTVLILALLMLSSSQDFISQSEKKELKGFYLAESQINWAALKLKEDPFYTGGSSPPDIYPVSDPKVKIVKIIVEPGEGNLEITDSDTEWYRVKTYIEFKPILGKRKPAVRVDATIIRHVEADPANPGFNKVWTEIKDWEEIRPPLDPEANP